MSESLFYAFSEMTRKTSQYPIGRELEYLALGLSGEAGEVANKIKKIIRGDPHNTSDQKIAEEIGDLLWYCDRLLVYLGSSMENEMKRTIIKLEGSLTRNTIKGNGDDR